MSTFKTSDAGYSITLFIDVNLFEISQTDLAWVLGLVETVRGRGPIPVHNPSITEPIAPATLVNDAEPAAAAAAAAAISWTFDEGDGNVIDPAELVQGKSKLPTNSVHACDVCGREFTAPQGLAAHRRSHEPAPPPCPHCGARFPQQTGLTRHLRQQHPGQPVAVTTLDAPTGPQEEEEEEEARLSDLPCPHCTLTFPTAVTLRDHLTRRHPATLKTASSGGPALAHSLDPLPAADTDDNPRDGDRCVCWHVRGRHDTADGHCHAGGCDCQEFARAAA